MIEHDDALDERLAVLALGALPKAEALELVAHVESCAACRNAYFGYRAAADLIGYAAEPEALTLDELRAARLRGRILQQVRGLSGVAQPAVTSPASRGGLGWLAAAAALVLAILSFGGYLSERSQTNRLGTQIAQVQSSAASLASGLAASQARERASAVQLAVAERSLAAVTEGNARRLPIPGGEVIAGRTLTIAVRLPQPPPGKVYQAWTLARGAKTLVPSLTFTPNASGLAVVTLPVSPANLAAVAVNVEPAGGTRTPTTKPTFVRTLS